MAGAAWLVARASVRPDISCQFAERLKNGLVAATFFACAQRAFIAAAMNCIVSSVGVQNPASALVVTIPLLPFFSSPMVERAKKARVPRKTVA